MSGTTEFAPHVVAGKLSPDQLAGDHKTLAGTTITVKGSGENFTVGKMDAKVICGNAYFVSRGFLARNLIYLNFRKSRRSEPQSASPF